MKIKSVATQLMLRVFTIYMVLALSITAIHIYLEYTESYQALKKELATVAKSMEPGLVTALWDININQTASVLKGAMEIPEITGLLLYNESQILVGALGVVNKKDGKIYQYSSLSHFSVVEPSYRLIPHSNNLSIKYGDGTSSVGSMVVFSNTGVVIQRIKVDVIYIIVGAVIKTAGLWLIFLYFSKRFLERPLQSFIASIHNSDVEKSRYQQVDTGVKIDNEISQLEGAYNELLAGLIKSQKENREAHTRLQYSESLLSNLIDVLPVGILLTDDNGKGLIVNQRWSDITGQAGMALNQRGPFHAIHPDDLSSVMVAWQKSNMESGVFCEEYRILKESGEVDWVLAQASHQQSTHNGSEKDQFKFTGFIWTLTVITSLKSAQKQVLELNKNLESRVESRTLDLNVANQELSNAVDSLKQAQGQLIESEKMAALGELVSGIAHEINTPIGVVLTASTYFEEQLIQLEKHFNNQSITKGLVKEFLLTSKDAGLIIHKNIRRASELISSFKMVAVDQHSDEARLFNVSNYIDEILISLTPMLKKTHVKVKVNCPEELEIENCPGVFYQVVSNLVINSLIHGFNNEDQGVINIGISKEGDHLHIDYKDDGKGMSNEVLDKLFNPFFTTKRGTGGSGLGTYIVYNLVTHRLGGTIKCSSIIGEGVHYQIKFPI